MRIIKSYPKIPVISNFSNQLTASNFSDYCKSNKIVITSRDKKGKFKKMTPVEFYVECMNHIDFKKNV